MLFRALSSRTSSDNINVTRERKLRQCTDYHGHVPFLRNHQIKALPHTPTISSVIPLSCISNSAENVFKVITVLVRRSSKRVTMAYVPQPEPPAYQGGAQYQPVPGFYQPPPPVMQQQQSSNVVVVNTQPSVSLMQ